MTRANGLLGLLLLLGILAGAVFLWRNHEGDARHLDYLALGDSITISGSPSYPELFSEHVSSDLGVDVTTTNLGIVGWASATLLYHLRTDQTYIDAVSNTELVTIMIGTNDFGLVRAAHFEGRCGGTDGWDCIRTGETEFRENYTSIIARIRSLNPHAVILVSDVYNPFIADDMRSGDAEVFSSFIERVNAYVHSIAAANRIPVAEVYEAFNGPNGLEDPIARGYLTDGVHPSSHGVEVIADQLGALSAVLKQRLLVRTDSPAKQEGHHNVRRMSTQE